jgi:hypothetical protein
VYAPAGMKLRFEKDNVVPRAFQFPSSRQPGEPRTEDRDTLRAPLPPRRILWQRPDWRRRKAQLAGRKSRQLQESPAIYWHDRAEYYRSAFFPPSAL